MRSKLACSSAFAGRASERHMKADPPSLRTVKGPINKAILISVGAVAVFFLISALLRPREPAYQGKPLSYWFEQFNTTNRSQAAIALREMGPAAVPFLLKKAKSKDGDSLYDKIYRTIYMKAPMGWKRRMALPKPFDDTFHYRVANALQLLGPAAVPQLIKGMADPN